MPVLLSHYITVGGLIVSDPDLLDIPIYDIQVVGWFDGLPKQEFDKLIMLPPEAGNAIEFRNSKNQHDNYVVHIRDLEDIYPVVEEKNGLTGTKDDMMVEVKFKEKESRRERLVRFNIGDKHVNEVTLLANQAKAIEQDYWDTVNVETTINGRRETIPMYYRTPFLSRGEKLIWHSFVDAGLFSHKVRKVRAITRYRVLEYDFRWHQIAMATHNHVSNIVVTNKKQVTESASSGTNSTSKSHTIGDVVFMVDGKQQVVFSGLEDPDGVAQIAEAARRNADFTVTKGQGVVNSTGSSSITCPKCSDTNPADARFCKNCGARFYFVCAKCNKANPQEASFCGACGSPLT